MWSFPRPGHDFGDHAERVHLSQFSPRLSSSYNQSSIYRNEIEDWAKDVTSERSDKLLLNALAGEVVAPQPTWLMRQAGRYLPEYRELRSKTSGFLELCLTPALASEVTLQPIRRFGFDGAIIFADILLVPYALGQRLWFVEGEGPRLEPLNLAKLKFDRAMLAPVFETIGRVKSELPGSTTLIGFAGAPWTVATYMIAGGGSDDSAAARLFAYQQPRAFAALIDVLVEATADYLIGQIDAGAEALQIFESWAGTIPVQDVDGFSLRPIRTIIDKVRRHSPATPVIVFPRGAGTNYPRYAQETGATAISLDAHTSIRWAQGAFPPATVLQGNLDPISLVAGGEALDREIDRILSDTDGNPHIFNLGHGIRPETPIAHVEQLVKRIRSGRA